MGLGAGASIVRILSWGFIVLIIKYAKAKISRPAIAPENLSFALVRASGFAGDKMYKAPAITKERKTQKKPKAVPKKNKYLA